jgi:dolichol-phosphate mannosyltransferase
VAPGSVSVVIPARDEEARLGPCLVGLRGDPAVGETIVVDDESTDATAAVARLHGVRVVDGRPRPDGWVGKPWALQQGLEAACGEWIVCLDADVRPGPGAIGAVVARADQDGFDLMTVAGAFVCDPPLLRVLHPAFLTTLVYRFGPPGAGRAPRVDRLLGNGQCTVSRRARMLADGGYAPAAPYLVDDVALVRATARAGRRVGFVDGADVIAVHMYTDARDAWRNWGRSLPLPGVTTSAWMVADLVTVWAAQVLPLVRVVRGVADAADVVGVVLRFGTLAGTARAYRRRGVAYWLSPLADAAAALRLTQVALRPEWSWRGRTYGPPSRTAGR